MRRTFVLVVVTASLLGSPQLFDPLWTLVSSLWSGSTVDAGCGFDPYGGCRTAPQPQPEAGCGWDPYGCPQGS
ncbi:MAG TPA: hypothetical protein VKM72_19800 [Thermoanaerobaculia bacterium]|nr:hypothetical protein [Thermoanaerobaculia bacterium]